MDDISDRFKQALEAGHKIVPASCSCGGQFVWHELRPSGAHENAGCICHNDPPSTVVVIITYAEVENLKHMMDNCDGPTKLFIGMAFIRGIIRKLKDKRNGV